MAEAMLLWLGLAAGFGIGFGLVVLRATRED